MNNNRDERDKITNLKDLREALRYLEPDSRPVRSDLNLWVSEFYIGNRKWFYEGCPDLKCKKSAQPDTRCEKCGTEVKQTVPHFIMGVEFSDQSGSIEITAYDDFSHKLLKGKDYTEDSLGEHVDLIRGLDKLSIEDRKK